MVKFNNIIPILYTVLWTSVNGKGCRELNVFLFGEEAVNYFETEMAAPDDGNNDLPPGYHYVISPVSLTKSFDDPFSFGTDPNWSSSFSGFNAGDWDIFPDMGSSDWYFGSETNPGDVNADANGNFNSGFNFNDNNHSPNDNTNQGFGGFGQMGGGLNGFDQSIEGNGSWGGFNGFDQSTEGNDDIWGIKEGDPDANGWGSWGGFGNWNDSGFNTEEPTSADYSIPDVDDSIANAQCINDNNENLYSTKLSGNITQAVIDELASYTSIQSLIIEPENLEDDLNFESLCIPEITFMASKFDKDVPTQFVKSLKNIDKMYVI